MFSPVLPESLPPRSLASPPRPLFPPAPRALSSRERQIVQGLVQAQTIKDIARDLNLSANTVKDYLKTIYAKAGVHSARELLAKLYVQPAAAAPPLSASSGLLTAVQQLIDCRDTDSRTAHLVESVRTCTRADRVTLWRGGRSPAPAGYQLCPYGGSGPALEGEFLAPLIERGSARLDPALFSPERHQLMLAGFHGQVLAVRPESSPRPLFLLAGNPRLGRFGVLDLATLQLLARLVQTCARRQPAAFATGA